MNRAAVIHRTKHDSGSPVPRGKELSEHPAMKELTRMVDSGEVSGKRTIAHLKKARKP